MQPASSRSAVFTAERVVLDQNVEREVARGERIVDAPVLAREICLLAVRSLEVWVAADARRCTRGIRRWGRRRRRGRGHAVRLITCEARYCGAARVDETRIAGVCRGGAEERATRYRGADR
eukprot:7320380-Prymnesium_polylepis.3